MCNKVVGDKVVCERGVCVKKLRAKELCVTKSFAIKLHVTEIHVKIQFWSNLLGLLIGFHWVPSIHALTNVIPTGFVSRCRRSLSIWSISDACTCRVQASVRLLKMLRHIISKVKIFSDWCSVGTVLLLKCCSSLAL